MILERITIDWGPVVGYEGFYEVSTHGQVQSLDHYTTDRLGRTRFYPGRILQAVGKYPAVVLCRDGVETQRRVHVLMAETFLGPCPPGQEVRHLDDDPQHLVITNLAYGTQSQNALDLVRNGRHPNARKTECPAGHRYTYRNTMWVGPTKSRRMCRTCARRKQRERYARQKGAA
jgi:hypothetical protein